VNNTHRLLRRLRRSVASSTSTAIPFVAGSCACSAHQHAEGVTNYLHADVRDPERILHEAARTLDFTRPVGLMLLGIIKYGGVARKP
jgi:hypothetical protein